MPILRIDHIQLAMPADGESKARHFYSDVLGMTELPKPAHLAARGGAWFYAGDVTIHVGVDPEFRPAKKAHPALVTSDYESLIERLEHSNVGIKCDAALEDGRPHCYVEDPFGNRIEIVGE